MNRPHGYTAGFTRSLGNMPNQEPGRAEGTGGIHAEVSNYGCETEEGHGKTMVRSWLWAEGVKGDIVGMVKVFHGNKVLELDIVKDEIIVKKLKDIHSDTA
jgi:hypothetical protein